jgi:hypothetical protein
MGESADSPPLITAVRTIIEEERSQERYARLKNSSSLRIVQKYSRKVA